MISKRASSRADDALFERWMPLRERGADLRHGSAPRGARNPGLSVLLLHPTRSANRDRSPRAARDSGRLPVGAEPLPVWTQDFGVSGMQALRRLPGGGTHDSR